MAPAGNQGSAEDFTDELVTGPGDLLGRRAELERLEEIYPTRGLVQIVGPPGSGTTRLLEAFVDRLPAEELVADEPLSVGEAATNDRLVRELLEAVQSPGETLPDEVAAQQLIRRLEQSPATVLPLDLPYGLASGVHLFEKVIDGAPSVTVVLATQYRHRVMGEAEVVPLRGLSEDAAIELFRRRTAVTDGDGASADRREDIVELVRALDRIPLAVEAAAELTRTLGVERIVNRWRNGGMRVFEKSAGGARGRLREVLEESWEMLEPPERRTLRRLSVSPAPFTADLFDALRPEGEESTVRVELLERLVEKSWLFRDRRAGTVEFQFGAPYRQFAAERRDLETDRPGRVFHQFAVYARDRLENFADQVESPPVGPTCERISERGDLFVRAAQAVADDEPEFALEILMRLVRFHPMFGQVESLRDQMSALLEDEELSPRLRVRALAKLVELNQHLGRGESSREQASRALELLSTFEADGATASRALLASSLALQRVDPDAARERLKEAAEVADRASTRIRARLGVRRGFLALQQFQLEEAREHFSEARSVSANCADPVVRGELASGLGYVSFRLDRPDAAIASFEEALEQERHIGNDVRIADARFNLGVVALAFGRLARARSELETAHEVWSDADQTERLVLSLNRLGMLFAEREMFERARTALRRAVRFADRAADTHNRAIAEGTLALVAMCQSDATPGAEVFRDALRELVLWRDPDIAAVFRVAVDLRRLLEEDDREPEREPEVALGGLQSLLGSQDHRLRRLIERLARLRVEAFEHSAPDAVRDEWRALLEVDRDEASDGDQDATFDAEYTSASARLLKRAIEGHLASEDDDRRWGPPDSEADHILRVHPEAHWFRVDDDPPVNLLNRAPLRRILSTIVSRTVDPSAGGATVDDLIELGWPDENPTRDSGASRVYNVIRLLREKGLDGIIITGDSGYCIDSSVALYLDRGSPDT